jgi:hypothetical protein
MAITFRTSKGAALTHVEMDENFSSVYFSSSIHNIPNSTSKELKLWFDNDTDDPTYHSVELPAPGGGTVTIDGNQNNRLLTATGGASLQGEQYLTFDGSILTLAGRFEPIDAAGNLSIGSGAGTNALDANNILIGQNAGYELHNQLNIAVGNSSLRNATGEANTVVGSDSLINLNGGDSNTALGYGTAENVGSGGGNLYLGYRAGPITNTPLQDNKLYINNIPDDTPLIYGDFATGQVTIHTQVSASLFSGSFVGNGAGLTGVSTTWNGIRNGNAQITGSLIVSGGVGTTVNFTGVSSISGSIFSGSFIGDGSGLTGITSTAIWNGRRNGNAEITGSFIVSGSSPTINLKGVTTIHQNIKIHNPTTDSIGVGENTLNNSPGSSVAVGFYAGSQAEDQTVSIGYAAGQSATSQTVAVGYGAGQGAGNESSYLGYLAGGGNNGKYSTGIGSQVLSKANESSFETALGYLSLFKVRQGYADVSIGAETLSSLETGAYNTAVGKGAFRNLIDGKANVGIGFEAGGPKLEKGARNVYIGANSGDYISEEYDQLYIDNSTRPDALIKGDFAQRILTLNAVKVFMPELLDIQQDYAGVMSLPIGALYKDGPFVMVRVP